MQRDEAIAVLNEAARDLALHRGPALPPADRQHLAADIRAELWQVEKTFYDRGFAEAAALHAQLDTLTQPS